MEEKQGLSPLLPLRTRRDFQTVLRQGLSFAGKYVVLYIFKNGANHNRLGIITSRKVGKAVVRNRLRRRVREIYRLHQEMLQTGYDFVVVTRFRASEVAYQTLLGEMRRLWERAGVWRE